MRPTQDFGGYIKVQGGDYGQYTLQGARQYSAVRYLFFRAAFSAQGNKGYIHNYFTDPATGFSNSQPAEGTQKLAGRFSLKWVPDDSFSLLVRADLSGEHDTGSSYHDLGYFVGTTLAHGQQAVGLQHSRRLCRLYRSAGPSGCVLLHDGDGDQRQRRQYRARRL